KRDEVAEDVTLEDLAEDIAAVMDCIGVARANVIGISMGGMIAQYLAVDHPDKVGKLVLGVTSYQLNDSIREYVNHNILMAKKGELGKLQEENFRKIHTRQYYSKHKKWVSLFSKIGIPKSNTRFIRLSQSILTLDMEERIHDIISPVLGLGAGEDKIVGKTAADDLVRELKCERYVYRKLGHGVYGEESKDFHERILRFMEKA
ncbi:MAG: alpha/beta hydrolase, partial [Lachnospiraceae bacterium]|nr:alpha/beta hydrolase [Lachnospiraceae bacterium]